MNETKHNEENITIDQETLDIRDNVSHTMQSYLANLDGQPVTGLYGMVLSEIEAPLLETVMEYTRGNQSNASTILGLNRGTFRKKLKVHGLIES